MSMARVCDVCGTARYGKFDDGIVIVGERWPRGLGIAPQMEKIHVCDPCWKSMTDTALKRSRNRKCSMCLR